MTRALVTGGSGFVGQGLIPVLIGNGHEVLAVHSTEGAARASTAAAGCTWFAADLRDPARLAAEAFDRVDAVIHLAALAHVPRREAGAPEAALQAINVRAPAALARRAANLGVRRFVFVSSLLVHGRSRAGQVLNETSPLAPDELYGQSKVEAEARLREIGAECGLELTIVRPPLVYGPGVKGNFLRLLRWALARWPLPTATLHNRRSFVGLANLCDLLCLAASHPAAANETFLAADPEDISTGELYRRIARAGGSKAWFLPLPRPLLAAGLGLAGKSEAAARLLGDLRADSVKARALLGWESLSSVEAELERTVGWYREHHARTA